MIDKIRQFLKFLVRVNPNIGQETDGIVAAVGGLENIVHSGACATRLRLQLNDSDLVDADFLKCNGAFGVVRLDKHNVQIIYGVKANNYAQEIDARLQAR
ncbi:glucose PTS transporter subunit EIIB [Vibrio ziniensis]|uniref:PTS transporter subunit EIIB n=1 Tax=Vibrio ziniensis TaxID=2711221 RepID=A0A6G7CGP2_9VIBR|nr:glucose PTS transporter subunit EIIB [Vibrio ziniensis]QIH41240.1 PTS transporter subunit EIIB [Vibrio ziniensis]